MTKKKLKDELESLKRRLSKIESDKGSSIITGDNRGIKKMYDRINIIKTMILSNNDKK